MNDKQRAEFEKWCKVNELRTQKQKTMMGASLGRYEFAPTEAAWEVWQEAWNAAIASVVVEIPSFFSDRYEADMIFPDDMENALKRAGVRYE